MTECFKSDAKPQSLYRCIILYYDYVVYNIKCLAERLETGGTN